jgi:glycosyltransferase involved in cell wall biosynthesis
VRASVLVPVLNEACQIRSTVDAMRRQRLDGELEVLLIDGRSTDGTREALLELSVADPRVRVLENPAGRIPAALNIGLRHARGEFVARMDAHSWYPEDYVQRGIERLARGDAAWVTGPQIPVGDGPWSRAVALALQLPIGQGGSRKWGGGEPAVGAGERDLDTGVFCGVWRRSTLEALGGWDEDWAVNEDVEMAARVLEAGGRIVCRADMGAAYRPRDSLQGLARQYCRFGLYRVKSARRHPRALRHSHLGAPCIALAGAAAVVAPGPVRRLARPLLALYLAGVTAGSLVVLRTASARDAAGVPVVLVVMHVAWGAGFLVGLARFGVPVRALADLLAPATRGGGHTREKEHQRYSSASSADSRLTE